MAETQVNAPQNAPVLGAHLALKADLLGNNKAGSGFSNMLQAFDLALTDTVRPHQAADTPSAKAEAGGTPEQQPEDKPAHTPDTAPAAKAHKSSGKGQKHEAAHKVGHGCAKNQTEEAPEKDAADTAPMNEDTAKDKISADATVAADDVLTAGDDKGKTPEQNGKTQQAAINLLAGQQAAAPKNAAPQKAVPQTEPKAGETVCAATAAAVAATTGLPDTAGTATVEAQAVPGSDVGLKNMSADKPPISAKPAGPQLPQNTAGAEDKAGDQAPGQNNQALTQLLNGAPAKAAAEPEHAKAAAQNDLPAAEPHAAQITPTITAPAPIAAARSGAAAKPADLPQHNTAQKTEISGVHLADGSGVRSFGSYASTTQLTAARNAQTAGLRGTEVAEQVAVKLNHQAKNGADQMTIQLRPADLGRIDIKLTFHDGAVSGTIVADQQSTLDMLAKDQRTLERALQDAGLRTDSGSLSFQLRDQSGQNAQQQERSGNGRARSDYRFDLTQDTAPAAANESAAIITADRVNLRV